MRRRHVIGPAVAGLVLTAAGVAMPSSASAATTAPCTDLLGCVVPTLTATTGVLTTTVTGTVQTLTTTTLPSVIDAVPTTLTTLLQGTKTITPTPKPVPHPTPHPTPHPRHTTHKVTRSTSGPGIVAPGVATRPGTAPQQGGPSTPSGRDGGTLAGLGGAVAKAVESVVNLFGWNLLALIPMAGIAFAISRRMATARSPIRL